MSFAPEVEARVRDVLNAHARLREDAKQLPSNADLYAVGMSSHASVNVMLGLEEAFDIEFPDQMLNRAIFASVEAITAAVASLRD